MSASKKHRKRSFVKSCIPVLEMRLEIGLMRAKLNVKPFNLRQTKQWVR